MKFARIPVALHGTHRHTFNYPWLGTANFMQVFPVYYRFLYNGEKANVMAPVFSRLNPIVNPAFATGRINFKAFFVPAKYVYRPWYHMDSGVEYDPQNGSALYVPQTAPYTSLERLGKAFVNTSIASPYVVEDTNPQTQGNADISYVDYSSGSPVTHYYNVTALGAAVLTTLNSLGYSPVFVDPSNGHLSRIEIVTLLSFIRIYLDYYFPNQYVGSHDYNYLNAVINLENADYNSDSAAAEILFAIAACSIGVYDSNLFDAAFDNPVAPSTNPTTPTYTIQDQSNDNTKPMAVTNDPSISGSPAASYNSRPNNGTPYIAGSDIAATSRSAYGVVTQYLMDSLQALNNFIKRHQLAGGRLIDNVLARRGYKLSHDTVLKPYFLGSDDVEINVDAVVNTTDQNLGELAGKGVAATNSPLKFSCSAMDDGVFMIVAFVKPDCDLPVYNDISHFYVDQLDMYHPEFDKLGVEAVSSLSLDQTLAGPGQSLSRGTVFGFLPRYSGYIQEHSRLCGDFRLMSRGKLSLQGFYTFRNLFSYPAVHGLNFVTAQDKAQYQRIFYSSACDNFQIFIRFKEVARLFKLPLGDSYDWDDDELNRRVNVAVTGSQTS